MPFYQQINSTTEEGKRTLDRLLSLRKSIKKQIPQRTLKETLLLATWNIRDFDKATYGDRLEEAIYYIAEIIASFDSGRYSRGLPRFIRLRARHESAWRSLEIYLY